MGIKLSTQGRNLEAAVTANVRGEEGQFFVGILKAYKTAPSQYKDQAGNVRNHNIYEFELVETDMELTKKVGNGYPLAKGVKAGDQVSIFAPTRLHNALSQAKPGQEVTIKYLGLGKASRMGGKPHEYDVEVA